MILCTCPRPVRNLADYDHLRCDNCGGWTPHGRCTTAAMHARTGETVRLLQHVADEYARAAELAPVRAVSVPVRTSAPADPTGNSASDPRARQIGLWRLLAACLVARAREAARLADEAMGMAFLAADPRPPERADGEWWPQITHPDEIDEAKAAQSRRHVRGET
jgi:hypothetical protein